MAHGEVKHDYHLVNPSPWPFTASVGAFIAAVGFVVSQKGLVADENNFFLSDGSWALFWIGMAILTITGDITLKKRGEARLHELIKGLIERGHKRVLLDLGGVSFVDSAGLGDMVQAHSLLKNEGGFLGICNITRRLLDLLTMTRLTSLFRTYESETKALASLGGAQ